MFKHTFQLLLLSCLMAETSWAATDSFVGDWKLNSSRSRYIDQMKVESLGGNKYEFDFGGGPERIAVDGTDQSGYSGTLLSVTVDGPDSWKVVRKKDGRMMLTAKWRLSQDGSTLTDDYTEFGADGSPSTVKYLYKRTTTGPGFAGTWESPIELGKYASALQLEIRRYEESGLSFIQSSQGVTRNVKFDGKDYPSVGRGVAPGSTSSARRVSAHALEITDRVKGAITRTEQIELSRDLKTLTRTVHPVGQREPNIFVFERL